jgi:hypothetical protein
LFTSNRSVGEWGAVFGDPVVATAILDRLLHHDAVNAVLAAAGYNFHLLLRWLELLLSRFLPAQKAAAALQWI